MSLQLNQQLGILEKSLRLSDLGIRLRFLIAHQLEFTLQSLFPQGCVLPFGSTVSGIGRQSGDLDLVLLPDKVMCKVIIHYDVILLLYANM